MSVATSQKRTLLALLGQLRPHWRHDPALPARIQALLAGRREFGSRDRRLYREFVYTTLRYLPWIDPLLDEAADEAVRRLAWLAADLPATRDFRQAFANGEPPAGDRAELLPAWFRAHCPEIFSGSELDAQLRRAPLWLRLQTARSEAVLAEFAARGWTWRESTVLPRAGQLLGEADVTATEAWRSGGVEVQDLGSQLLLAAVGVAPGEHWLDACAGAGGKTLQLATLLGGAGRITAHDIRAAALDELTRRLTRAKRQGGGAEWAAVRVQRETVGAGEKFDGVLVDAPCSGTGTWRRSPHLKWCTTEQQVIRAAAKQRDLLEEFSRHTRPGGRLVYATCSLSSRENEEVVEAFLGAHPEFNADSPGRTFGAQQRGPGLLILPGLHDSDGFFVAAMRRA